MTFTTPITPSRTVSAREHLATLFTVADLDREMDQTSRFSRATVATFAAAPADTWNEHCTGGEWPAVEIVVEFFVPPPSLEAFHRDLESRLLRASPAYLAARSRGLFAPCILRCVPAGSFHQHRLADRRTAVHDHERWSHSREFIAGLLHQVRIGWRDTVA